MRLCFAYILRIYSFYSKKDTLELLETAHLDFFSFEFSYLNSNRNTKLELLNRSQISLSVSVGFFLSATPFPQIGPLPEVWEQ